MVCHGRFSRGVEVIICCFGEILLFVISFAYWEKEGR